MALLNYCLEYLDSAVEDLLALGAVKRSEARDDRLFITELGRSFVVFPVDPKHAL